MICNKTDFKTMSSTQKKTKCLKKKLENAQQNQTDAINRFEILQKSTRDTTFFYHSAT